MQNKILKISFKGFFPGFNPSKNAFFSYLINNSLILIDDKSPDVIIWSDYESPLLYNKKNILFSMENIPIKNWLYKYSVTSKVNNKYNLRFNNFFYYPYYYEAITDSLNSRILKLRSLKKNRNINFIYSNKKATLRNNFYIFLSNYFSIDSYGNAFNNMGALPDSLDRMVQKLDIIANYKYTIAFENSFGECYVTEKIFHPLLVNSIPIYFGPNLVFNFFNKNKIIYISQKSDFEGALKKIREINKSKDLYENILSQDMFASDNVRLLYGYENLAKNFLNFLNKASLDNKPLSGTEFLKKIKYYTHMFFLIYF